MADDLSIDEIELLSALASHPVQIVRETWRWAAARKLQDLGLAKSGASRDTHLVEITARGMTEARRMNIIKE